jgi:hypothetical protein
MIRLPLIFRPKARAAVEDALAAWRAGLERPRARGGLMIALMIEARRAAGAES